MSALICIACAPRCWRLGGWFLWQRWGRSTSKDGGTSLSIELLHALVMSGFAGSSGGLVGLDPRYVVRVVDVP
jgi:hypothetical protein